MKTIFLLASLCLFGSMQAQMYQNSIPVNVPDATHVTGDCASGTAAGNASRVINVPISDTITDPSKVTINLNIAHTWLGDVVAELRTPSGSNCALIKRLGAISSAACGSSANFVAGNTLSFNSSNSITIPYTGLTSSDNIPAGIYSPIEGNDSTHYPQTIPLCNLHTFLDGVSILGNWALVMYDHGVGDVGSIQSWQIVFAPGFGDPISNVGIDQEIILSNSLTILGNPFKEQLSLVFNAQNAAKAILHVYAMDGKEVYEKSMSSIHVGGVMNIETSSWGKWYVYGRC
jgi:subtilisin-like proprotein convertase family protein